jgi:hypothetical protein
MLILTQPEVRELLDRDALVDALAAAHADLSAGKASMPPRVAALVEAHDGLLGVMPSYLPSAGLACKLVTLFPHNRDRETHQAIVCVFDPDSGTPIALMDGTYITATRTAAGSALATRLLAREDARVLAILGTGVQAHSHAHALPRVRSFEEIRVAGRDPARVRAFAREIGGVGIGGGTGERGPFCRGGGARGDRARRRRLWLDWPLASLRFCCWPCRHWRATGRSSMCSAIRGIFDISRSRNSACSTARAAIIPISSSSISATTAGLRARHCRPSRTAIPTT